MSSSNFKLGLSLSGGGYRAAAFHLGTLKKLQELKILEKVDILSTISGGSITGGFYCLEKEDFTKFEQKLYDSLQHKNVVKQVLFSLIFLKLLSFALIFLIPALYFLFTPYAWLFPILLTFFILLIIKYQFDIFPVSTRIEKIYDDFFFHYRKLKDLPDKPVLVIGSTNLQTARTFTFSRTWMQDSTYQFLKEPIKFKAAEFPISKAVMASSCVPFAFSPVSIDIQFFQLNDDASRVHPMLVDGGVYDNQGIHKIMQQGYYACSSIIASDAGGSTPSEFRFKNTIALLIRTVDVFMLRIKKLQIVQDIYENAGNANKQIAYISLGWDIEKCIPGFIDNLANKNIIESVINAHELLPEWVDDPKNYTSLIIGRLEQSTNYKDIQKPSPDEKYIARNVGTNLKSLTKNQINCLMKQAECLTELQVKLYCPSLIIKS